MTDHLDEMLARHDWLRMQAEPLDAESIDLITEQLGIELAKANRLLNTLINRPKGLPEAALNCARTIKLELSELRYYLDHRNELQVQPELRALVLMMVDQHSEDHDELGDAARRLRAILGDDA